MYLTQTLRRAVQISGNKTATVFGARRQTWREFEQRIARLAGAFRAMGINDDDRIAILSLNSDRYVEYFYAVAWAGAAANPVNIRLAVPEIAYTLEDSASSILLVDDTFAAMLPALVPLLTTVRHIVYMGDGATPDGCENYEALIAASVPVRDANAGGDRLAGLFYTGGTTGKSKGVMLSHDNLVYNALNVIPVMGYNDASVYLHAGPMFHLADMASTFAVTMAGATHCAVARFDVDAVLGAIQKERVTHVLLVPTMVNLLVSSGKIAAHDTSSMQRMLYGASPMPEAVLVEAMRQMPDVRFTQGYGQTEASPIITALAPEHHVIGGPKLRSAGRPAFGVDVAVLDAEDREVPRGTVGEVCARGLNVMRGYWGIEKQTRETLRNDWLHTGDLGYMDDDGFVFIVDRAKDMVIRGGENVYCSEVEAAIYHHDAVVEAIVFGVPDERLGEAVVAVIVLRPDASLTADELREFLSTDLSAYKIPSKVWFRDEPIPRNASGKFLKREVRDQILGS